jgi:membrane protein YqaA with SNARE-associated domain
MQTALALRRFSINSLAATFAVLLALTAGGAGGYWLGSQASSVVMKAAAPQAAGQMQHVDLNVSDAADRAARIANAAQTSSSVPHDDDHGR